MYKKDKQGIVIVLVALTVLLGCAIAFRWQGIVVASAIGLTVAIVHILSEIHQRLQQLERTAPSYFAQSTSITSQKLVIYASALVTLFAYANTWMWLAGGALLVLMLCLIQTISSYQTRLLHLEQYAIHSAETKMPTPQASIDDQNLELAPTYTSNELANDHHPTWMQTDQAIPQKQTNENLISEYPETKRKQPAWWQPAIDWMIHGNPILRVAVTVLMVGIVLLLRFASEHWQLSLGVKLGFIASVGIVTTIAGYWLQKKNQLFAVALQGLGLAVVFLTVIFSHHFAVIASLGTASTLFVILLLVTVYLSLKQQALYLAMLALTMAYLAPLLIPQNHPDVIFLFGYYFLINLAVAAVNFIQPWKILHQIAFFATMFIGGTTIGIYALQPILDVGLIFSVPVLGFSLHAYLMHNSTQALTIGAAVLSLTYTLLHVWIKRQHPQLSILAKSFFILAMVFTALIFPLAKGAHWTSVGWVIQGTALIVWGVTERYRLSRYLGVALVLLSSVALLFQAWSNDHFPILSTFIYASAQFISAFYLLHYQEVEKYFSARMLSGVFLALGMYAGAVAGVEYLHWQHYGLSPYLMISTICLALFSLVVQFKSRMQWHNVQLILLSGLLFLLYGESFAANVYAIWHWQSTLTQITFAVTAIVLAGTLISLQSTASKTLLMIGATLLWLSLAIIGLAIFPIIPIVALAIVPAVYGLWLFYSNRIQQLQQLPIWCLTLFWLVIVNIDPYSATQFYLLPVLNPTDVLSLLMFIGVLWVIFRNTIMGWCNLVKW